MRDEMKKLLAVMLCLAMVFCFAACKDDPGNGDPEEVITDEEGVDPEDPTNDPAETEEEQGEEDETEDVTIETLEDKEADLMALQEAAEKSKEPHTGTYVEIVAGKGIIIVNKFSDVYSVVISWSDSAFETYEWSFTGTFNPDGVLEYKDCLKKDITYENEEEATVSKVYENGTGRLRLTDDGLIWEDDIEHVADDANFVNTGV